MASSPGTPKRPKARRSRRPKANREAAVTQAASAIFAEKGYPVASIQDVADKVGVLKGSLYYYIQSKEDLLWRIIERVHGVSDQILQDSRTLDVSPIDRIEIYIKRHVEWYLGNVQEVSVYFREWRHLTGKRLREVKARRLGYEQVVEELLAAARDSGDISPELDLT